MARRAKTDTAKPASDAEAPKEDPKATEPEENRDAPVEADAPKPEDDAAADEAAKTPETGETASERDTPAEASATDEPAETPAEGETPAEPAEKVRATGEGQLAADPELEVPPEQPPEAESEEPATGDTPADASAAPATSSTEDTSSSGPAMAADPFLQPDSGAPGATPPPPTTSAAMTEPPRRSATPLVLAGILTAAIGFGAAWYLFSDGGPLAGNRVATLETKVSDLETRLASAESSAKAAEDGLANTVSVDTVDAVKTQVDTLSGTVTTLQNQVQDLRTRPPEADPAATAAYERELKAMREMIESELQKVRDAQAEAAKTQEAAQKAGASAEVVKALTEIGNALDTGGSFGDQLDQIAGLDSSLPVDGLRPFADGVETMAALRDSFPDAARAAIAAERSASNGGVAGFLSGVLGLRSLEPKEGDSADAILSRAEASLKNGDLAGSLSELDALQAPAAQAMSDWRAAAERRLNALSAYNTLSDGVRT